jgi:anti-sigma factor RsiW
MKCENLTERLDDYLDGHLPRAERDEIEGHLRGCSACGREADGLRQLLRDAAALPREIAPGRDLWPGIEARLGRRGVMLSPLALAAAATLIVALTATLTLVLSRDESVVRPGLAPEATITQAGLEAASIGDLGVLEAEAHFERAAAGLLVELEARREILSPETMTAVEHNLRDIDIALREIRDALREDPANRGLVGMLGSTHRKKLWMLERVVRYSPTQS